MLQSVWCLLCVCVCVCVCESWSLRLVNCFKERKGGEMVLAGWLANNWWE